MPQTVQSCPVPLPAKTLPSTEKSEPADKASTDHLTESDIGSVRVLVHEDPLVSCFDWCVPSQSQGSRCSRVPTVQGQSEGGGSMRPHTGESTDYRLTVGFPT
jgi:hypothetical protein